MSEETEQESGLGKDRISAFSDGVFAIAITLLVLDVRVPDPLHTTSAQLPGRLLHLWPELFSYALSFVIIGVYWVAHHLMLHAVQRADRTLLWINNGLLLFMALVPFSAGLLGQFRHDSLAVAVYGANLVLASTAFEVLWTYITQASHLVDRPLSPWLVRAGHLRTLAAIGIYLCAVGLAFVVPTLSLTLYCLVPIGYAVFQSRDDRRAIFAQRVVPAQETAPTPLPPVRASQIPQASASPPAVRRQSPPPEAPPLPAPGPSRETDHH